MNRRRGLDRQLVTRAFHVAFADAMARDPSVSPAALLEAYDRIVTRLTPRQLEIVEALMVPGATQERVADHMGIAVQTVRNQMQAAYRAFGVRSFRALVRELEASGLGDAPAGTARPRSSRPTSRVHASLR